MIHPSRFSRQTKQTLSSIINSAKHLAQSNIQWQSYKNTPPIKSVNDFARLPFSSREQFYQHAFFDTTSVFIMKGREDASGNEPIIPFSKQDYLRMIEYESYKFRLLGVKKSDVVTFLHCTQNHAIPMAQAIMDIGATYVVLEGSEQKLFADMYKRRVTVAFMSRQLLHRLMEFQTKYNQKNSIRMIITAGDAIPDFDQLGYSLKQTCGAVLVDTIGTRELACYAYKKFPQKMYNFLPHHQIVEIIDQKTGIHSDVGEVVITPLWRRDFPLIRFRTGDFIEYDHGFQQVTHEHNLTKYGIALMPLENVHRIFRHVFFYLHPLLRFYSQWDVPQHITIAYRHLGRDVFCFFVQKKLIYKLCRVKSKTISIFGEKSYDHPYIIEVETDVFIKLTRLIKTTHLDIRYVSDKHISPLIKQLIIAKLMEEG